jgi:hypothetical protein
MALKKVEDGHKTTKIDKVIAGGRGIEVNGIASGIRRQVGRLVLLKLVRLLS